MKIRFLFLFIILFFQGTSQAQGVLEKLFFQGGVQVGYFNLPSYDRLNIAGEKFAEQEQFYDVGLNIGLRYNIVELSDEQSIGLIANFGFGIIGGNTILVASEEKNGIYNIPIDLSYHYGAGSTYSSNKDFGFTVRAGVDFNYFFTTTGFVSNEYQDFKRKYVLPHLGVGVTFWGFESDVMQEIFVRFEFGKNQHTGPVLNNKSIVSPIGIRLAYTAFIGFN